MNPVWLQAPVFQEGLLAATLLFPLVLTPALFARSLRAVALALAPWAALPGLALASAPEFHVELPWLLLHTRLGLDAAGRLFLAFTALLWLIAGLYARSYLAADPLRHRFTAKNLVLDALPSAVATSPARNLIVALFLAGFGVKVGALGLHVWLPLVYPAAPVPASAALSGAVIKAGLLGWLRFLPLGQAALPEWGYGCVAAGFAAAFYGVAVGVTQSDSKTVYQRRAGQAGTQRHRRFAARSGSGPGGVGAVFCRVGNGRAVVAMPVPGMA